MRQKNYYSELYRLHKKDYEKMSEDFLVKDTLTSPKYGKEKLREVSGMDMEDASQTDFVPAMFYTFLYKSPTMFTNKNAPFLDVAPLILCTNISETRVQGFNMNFLPNDVRARLLDVIVESNPEFYEDETSDDFRTNEKLAMTFMDQNGMQGFLDMMKRTSVKFDLGHALRTYRRDFISNVRLIEMDMWKYIPFLNFKDSVRGLNLAKLQVEGTLKSNEEGNSFSK